MIASSRAHPRIGIIVPRHGRSAVERNSLKRRLREIVRVHLLPTLPAMDLVIRSRPTAYEVSFASLAREVDEARSSIPMLGE
jgi:ribonuclease P protein component